ncbi:MAG: hypothetical protein LAP40_06625 [Acidobacteriia bacterium]|nr:hypothetical protein [Terriglobia bacterium]
MNMTKVRALITVRCWRVNVAADTGAAEQVENGADAGFDPIDHTKVDQRLGSWDDVRSLSRVVDIMADLIGRPEERQQMNAAEQAGERAIEKLLKFTHAAAGKAIDISNQLDLVFHTRCSISSSRMRAVSG